MKHLFYLSMIAFLLLSCEKEPNTLAPDPSHSYFPLQIGNYWVYEHVQIHPEISYAGPPKVDSIIVDRDTLIHGKRYFILEGTNYPVTGDNWGIVAILRDSLGYVVDQTGKIKFSDSNFSDILDSKLEVLNGDTLYSLSYQMVKEEDPYLVPAGTFEVLNYKGTVYSFKNSPGIENPRYLHTRYSRGVGKVMQSYFYLYSPLLIEKILVRYHINP